MDFGTVIAIAVVLEAVITNVAWALEGKIDWKRIASLAGGIVLAILFQVDVLASLGLTAIVPFVGQVLTGILISRGANVFYDVVKAIKAISSPVG